MKKRFAFLLIGIIVLMILTFVLQILFNDQTKSFGLSCGILFLSTFCVFCYKDALTPTKERIGRPINTTKRYYEKRGKLYKYQSLCKILFIITISAAAWAFMSGLVEILIIYIISVFRS